MKNNILKNLIAAIAIIFTIGFSDVLALEFDFKINPNKLPLCQSPDYSKKTDVERTIKWNNCWGKYKLEFLQNNIGGVYESEWKNGYPNGKGAYFYSNGDKYVGEFRDGRFNGRGFYTSVSGNRQEGNWKNNKYVGEEVVDSLNRDGLSKINSLKINETNEKEIKNNIPACKGPDKKNWNNCISEFIYSIGAKYYGEFKNGKEDGHGEMVFKDGGKYIGEFKDGMQNGFGSEIFAFGAKYTGEYKNNKIDGSGRTVYANRNVYKGEYKDGVFSGKGIYVVSDGHTYEGIWADGKFIREERIDLVEFKNSTLNKNELQNNDNKLDSELKKIEDEKRTRAPTRKNQRINLQVSNTKPNNDGDFEISIQTNTDTASLKINDEEQGGKPDGVYTIKKVARAGQETKFTIVAKDINGNVDSKIISVIRSLSDSIVKQASLDLANIKARPSSDAVAIIIGIQNYKRIAKADFANQDAQDFYDYAIRAIGIKPENIKLLTDADADDVEITKAFQNWLPLKVKKNKTDVYVFYSGHGLPSEDGKSLYILPYGVDRDLINKTAINQQEIITALQAAQPKTVTMFIDSCYSGQTRVGETLIAGIKPVTLKAKEMSYPPEFTVITASQPDQLSIASTELKHGIFSFYLMKGMEGDADENKDGKITVGEMQGYLAEMVPRQAMTMNRKQIPQLTGDANRVLVGR